MAYFLLFFFLVRLRLGLARCGEKNKLNIHSMNFILQNRSVVSGLRSARDKEQQE
jgi:hypothetical protein